MGAQQSQGGEGPTAARAPMLGAVCSDREGMARVAAGWRCSNCRELGLFPLLRVGQFESMHFPSYLNLVEKTFFCKLIAGRVFRVALGGGISRIATGGSAWAVLGPAWSLQHTEPLKSKTLRILRLPEDPLSLWSPLLKTQCRLLVSFLHRT